MKKIAFFDFDMTIYEGYTYGDFIYYVSKHIFKSNKYPDKAHQIINNTPDYNGRAVKIAEVVGEMIAGWPQEKFEKYCKLSCRKDKIMDWVGPVFKYLKDSGFEIVIITAAFEEMLIDSLEVLKIDHARYSIFEMIDGRYTGKIKLSLNADRKAIAVQSFISEDTYTVSFGDSMGDAPMLEITDLAFLTKADDQQILNLANKKGWAIGSNPDKIIHSINNDLAKLK